MCVVESGFVWQIPGNTRRKPTVDLTLGQHRRLSANIKAAWVSVNEMNGV